MDFLRSIPYPSLGLVAAVVTAYAGLCRALRFRHVQNVEKKYADLKKSLGTMTDLQAWEIIRDIMEMEFPALYEKGLQLALFRTYGIPSIARLLVQTAQLSTNENVGKRYADTTVILTEMYGHAPTSKRSIEANARLNYLHGHYIKAGRISNDDMLYTLALFMNHPVEWINKYEWRQLTELELCAVGTYHKSMGDGMHISFDVLPGSKTGFKDGLQFYRELDQWTKEYEARVMVPHVDNYRTAIKTKDLFLSTVPSLGHGLVAQGISAVMDDRLREAIMFEPAHPLTKASLNLILNTRKVLLRHFALPRIEAQRAQSISPKAGPDGRRWIDIWSIQPQYVKPSLWNRWGPPGLYQLMLGAPRPGDPGMYPEGFLSTDVGPRAFDGKGKDAVQHEIEQLSKMRTVGCPFNR